MSLRDSSCLGACVFCSCDFLCVMDFILEVFWFVFHQQHNRPPDVLRQLNFFLYQAESLSLHDQSRVTCSMPESLFF